MSGRIEDLALGLLTKQPTHPWEQPWFAKAVEADDLRAAGLPFDEAAMESKRLMRPEGRSRFLDSTKGKKPKQAPKPKLPKGMIEMSTPESDFMATELVKEGSPRHIQMLKEAVEMEPDGPEALELKRLSGGGIRV